MGNTRPKGKSAVASGPPAVLPRHEYRAPRLMVPPLNPSGNRAGRVPLLTDGMGEEIKDDAACIALAWTDRALYLSASVAHLPTLHRPELPPQHPDFWRQEHIDFHVQSTGGKLLQFILAPDGRVMDNARDKPGDALVAEGAIDEESWSASVRIPWAVLGVAEATAGLVLQAQLAHVRWQGQRPDLAMFAATPLGFGQRERLGQLELLPEDPPIALHRVTANGENLLAGENLITLRFAKASDSYGNCWIRQEVGSREHVARYVEIRDEESTSTASLCRPTYRWFTVGYKDKKRVRELGAFTLRAPVSALPELGALVHPYLYFDKHELLELRRKVELPVFSGVREAMVTAVERVAGCVDVPSAGKDGLAITSGCLNWFRVAKETLLRDGEGAKCPKAAYLWACFDDSAQDAWREVVRTVQVTDGQLAILLPAFNQLVARRDFYDADAFQTVVLPEEAERMLAAGLEALSELELVRFNRIVLQSAIECFKPFKLELIQEVWACFEQWLVLNDDRLIEHATTVIEAADKVMIPGAHIDLQEANVCGRLAIAYDAFHTHLSNSQRETWVRVLERFLVLHLRTAREQHWNCTSIPNANPVCNGNGGLVALALLRERPELAAESLQLARKFIWNWVDYCNGPDGGNTEGCQYWQYGSDSFYRFVAALEHVLETDDGFLAEPAIRRHMNMVQVALSNDGALHGINDSIPMPMGADIAWFHAGRYDDAFALWYGDHAVRQYREMLAAGRAVPYHEPGFWALLFRPEKDEAFEQPALPTCQVLRDIEYGVLRSGPEWNCRLVTFMKGARPPFTHHNQPDVGAISVHLRGERLLIDPGYYKAHPNCHCLPMIGGIGPRTPDDWAGRFVGYGEASACKWLQCDVTAAYDNVTRVVRHLVMLGDAALVLLDDIVPHGGEAAVVAQFQAGASVTVDGDCGFAIEGRAKLRVQLFGPTVRLSRQDERTLHDVHWGYHFAQCRHVPVTAEYTATAETPLLSVLTDETDGPLMPEVEQEGDAITIAVGEHKLRIHRRHDGWQLD